MLKRVLLIVVVLAVLGGLLIYSQWRQVKPKVSGFVEAHEIRLGSRVGGRVEKILVDEGTVVKAGQPLVELAPFDLRELRSQAQAQLAARKADLQKLLAGFRPEEIAQAKAKRDELQAKVAELVAGPRNETIEASKARLVQAKAEEDYARSSFDKMNKSFSAGVATREELDKATQVLHVANALVQMRQQELAELQAGTRAEDVDMAKAQLAQAEQAYLLLKNGPRQEDIDAAKAAAEAADLAGILRGDKGEGPESVFIMGGGSGGSGEETDTQSTAAPDKQAKKAGKKGKGWQGVRTKRYTYVQGGGGEVPTGGLLYDNEKDPYQMHNRIDDPASAETRKNLHDMLLKWRKRVGETA